MTNYAYAALGTILAGCAIYAADKLLARRILIAVEVRKFRRDMNLHLAAVAQLEDEIAEAKRRLREHYGDDGGDT